MRPSLVVLNDVFSFETRLLLEAADSVGVSCRTVEVSSGLWFDQLDPALPCLNLISSPVARAAVSSSLRGRGLKPLNLALAERSAVDVASTLHDLSLEGLTSEVFLLFREPQVKELIAQGRLRYPFWIRGSRRGRGDIRTLVRSEAALEAVLEHREHLVDEPFVVQVHPEADAMARLTIIGSRRFWSQGAISPSGRHALAPCDETEELSDVAARLYRYLWDRFGTPLWAQFDLLISRGGRRCWVFDLSDLPELMPLKDRRAELVEALASVVEEVMADGGGQTL